MDDNGRGRSHTDEQGGRVRCVLRRDVALARPILLSGVRRRASPGVSG